MKKVRTANKTVKENALIRACGQYLTDYPQKGLTNEEFEKFVEEHLWEGVENLPLSEVFGQIRQLQDSFISFYEYEK